MGQFYVRGGNKLFGELSIGGSKNAILPILASTILHDGISVIHNCPNIEDTKISIKMLQSIGCTVKVEGSTVIVDATSANHTDLPADLVQKMRSSFIFLGSVLGRFGKVKISYPGGCELGTRPINLHLEALRKMGAIIIEEGSFLNCSAHVLNGCRINLDFPSVGATQNIMLSAFLANGETIIENAAREPEIEDLEKFLNSIGGRVRGAGTKTIFITGVSKTRDAEHTVIPDRIVAGTFLVAGAMTGGKIGLKNIVTEHLSPILTKLAEAGAEVESWQDKVMISAPSRLKRIKLLETLPHPGFPTDMQPQFAAMLALADGQSIIAERLFESRDKHIPELNSMGADIILKPDGITSVINGVKSMTGGTVQAKDLRGGAALILAGLAANGETIVTNSEHIERGYEHIERSLSQLGAEIKFLS